MPGDTGDDFGYFAGRGGTMDPTAHSSLWDPKVHSPMAYLLPTATGGGTGYIPRGLAGEVGGGFVSNAPGGSVFSTTPMWDNYTTSGYTYEGPSGWQPTYVEPATTTPTAPAAPAAPTRVTGPPPSPMERAGLLGGGDYGQQLQNMQRMFQSIMHDRQGLSGGLGGPPGANAPWMGGGRPQFQQARPQVQQQGGLLAQQPYQQVPNQRASRGLLGGGGFLG